MGSAKGSFLLILLVKSQVNHHSLLFVFISVFLRKVPAWQFPAFQIIPRTSPIRSISGLLVYSCTTVSVFSVLLQSVESSQTFYLGERLQDGIGYLEPVAYVTDDKFQ